MLNFFRASSSNIKRATILVISSAIKTHNVEFKEAKKEKFTYI